MGNIDNKVARATKWSLITEIIAKLISPIVNMILARLLVPEAFGAVATITMIISFAEIFTDAGFQKYIVQHEFEDDDDFDKSVNVAFWSNLTLSMVFVLAIWIFRNSLAELVGSPDLGIGIAIASFNIICVAFSSIQMAIYRRNFRFKTLFYVRMITSLIPLAVTVPLALIFRNYWALLLGTLSMHFVQAAILTMKSKWKPRFYYSLRRLKEMISFTSFTMLETVAIWLTQYADTFIVGKFLSDYFLGLYKTSITTVNAYMNIITSSIVPVLFAALSRYQNDDKEFKKTYFNFQKMVAIFLLPMSIGLYIYRDLVVSILLGKGWEEASGFVGLWGLTSAITIVLSYFASEVYRSKGKPNISLMLQLFHLLILVPALLLSVNRGFETLYTVRSIVRLECLVSAPIVLSAIFKIRIKDTVMNILPQTVSAIAMGVVSVFIKDMFGGMIWQFVTVGICIVIYFGVLLLFPDMRKTILEVKLVKKIVNKIKKQLRYK